MDQPVAPPVAPEAPPVPPSAPPAAPPAPPAPPEAPPAPPVPPAEPPKPSVDFDALGKEVAEKGALSDESLKALTDLGIPKEIVDTYVSNFKASTDLAQKQVESEEAELLGMVGGKESYGKMQAWMLANLSQEELQAYNEAVSNGSLDHAKFALAGVFSRYSAATAAPPDLLEGGGGAAGSGYASLAEYTKDVGNPQYEQDPAFRARVYAKLQATTSF